VESQCLRLNLLHRIPSARYRCPSAVCCQSFGLHCRLQFLRRTIDEYDKLSSVPLQACRVFIQDLNIQDLNPTQHSLEVTAETLHEAVAQALTILRVQDWVGEIGKGLTTATVTVRHPEVTHTVKIQDFENRLNRGCKSLAETAL